MEKIIKVLITKQGRKFYIRDANKDMHTQYGFLSKDDIKTAKDGDCLTSNTNKEFYIFTPSFIDVYNKIKRDAQIIPLKDIGYIIAETGISKDSRILDSGSGSGALACFLASVAKVVTTYEIRDDFIKIVESNIEHLNLKNVKVKKMNIYENIEDNNNDVITLDLPEPWNAVENCKKALKPGGFLVSYSPTIPQVMDFVRAIKKDKSFVYIKTGEIIEREWDIDERKVRPKSQAIGHSGFISIARKVN
jgi:tRNA (adenine57-N1/adenine58-N1)-methyltransferase catalytic subunit